VNYPPSTAPPVNEHLEDALKEAVEGARERGIPIGCVLTYVGDDGVERVVSRGRNKRVQDRSATRTAVIDCLENAGRQKAHVYKRCAIYVTTAPEMLSAGAIKLYGIPKVVVGDASQYAGAIDFLAQSGVSVQVVGDNRCLQVGLRWLPRTLAYR